MASEEELTSDSLDTTETDIPEDLLGYVRDHVIDHIKQTQFSAKIQHTEGQSPKLVLSFESKDHRNAKQKHGSSDTKNTDTILLENLPPTADEDLLEVFFESKKKYGGGPVKEVRIIRDKSMAYVKFCEASAVETVLKKKPIMLGTSELSVRPYKPLLPCNETITRADMMGLPLPKNFTEGLLKRYSDPVPTYGPELAAMIKVGSRVVRGKDWKWEDQDGNAEGTVIVSTPFEDSDWVRVKWDKGNENSYRNGVKGCYDLQLAYFL